ncbi:transcription factor 24 [Tachyglossus aculeatus]|uniref:transcription factor 24 n=1 Tax=Tachyglossus aculeatus TaxID=9261 RepID=UPI0018F37BB7|nr:transcription factor 24 [Tachyglossus aculeatus]
MTADSKGSFPSWKPCREALPRGPRSMDGGGGVGPGSRRLPSPERGGPGAGGPGGPGGPVAGGPAPRAPGAGRPAAANAARERSRVQTLRHAFLELQRTLPSVPPDTKLSKLDVLLLATTYIAHLTRSLQDHDDPNLATPVEPGPGALRAHGYLHPVKKWPMRSRLYVGATGQFLNHLVPGEKANPDETSTDSQT